MGNNTKNTFFNVSVTIALLGFMLYFIQEIIYWIKINPASISEALPLSILISDILMIISIILAIVLLFVGFDKVKIFRSVVMLFSLYLLSYTLATTFFPFFDSGSWTMPTNNIVEFYKDSFLSFIALLILGLAALYVFIFSAIKMKEDEITIAEKFSYILVLSIMIVFNIANLHFVRFYLVGSAFPFYGFLFIPFILEMILLAMLVILLTINLVVENNKIVSIFGLLLLNIFLISIITTASVGTTFDFTISNDYIPFALANSLLVLGTVLTFISSIIVAKKQLEDA